MAATTDTRSDHADRAYISPHAASPYIVHVPHSSIRIPDDVRPWLLLDDDVLGCY